MAAIEISELAEHPHFGTLLARWHVAEWGHLYPDWTEAVATAEFAAMDRSGEIPTTWLAFDGPGRTSDDLLGSVSLLSSDDLAGFDHLGPWLGSLFVRPDARGRHVGSILTRHCVREAARLGHSRLYLFTGGQVAYYKALGWRPETTADAQGVEVTVMARDTSSFAARRAVTSRWCTDPDFGGAYSYLRAGASPADRHRLAEPIVPGLVLAGEATWAAHPGTTHGAWLSGRRAADQVIEWGDDPVIVIGAGLAGLAAAHRLRSAGATVTVLEAGTQIGGRLREDHTLGGPVLLGAGWLHGRENHPLVALDPELASQSWRWTDDPVFAIGTGRLSESIVRGASSHYSAMEQRIDQARRTAQTNEAIGPLLRTALDESGAQGWERTIMAAWWRSEIESVFAAPIDEFSLRHGAEPYQLPGDDELIVSSPEKALAEAAVGLDIRLGRRVASVRHVGGRRWQVATETGAALSAHAVIVAVPHGVLRRGGITFEPGLPSDVVAAIDRVGFGSVTKVFASFDEAWWAPLKSFWVVGERRPVLELFYDASALAGRPTLGSFALGPAGLDLEQRTESEVCALVTSILTQAGLPLALR